MTSARPLRVVWSACHTGAFSATYLHDVIDRAAAAGVQGVEVSGPCVTASALYREFPAVAAAVNLDDAASRLEALRSLSEHAAARGLRFGVWHHELSGPPDWLNRMPELRAPDGLIDLDNPLLYRFITARLRDFLEACPQVGEIVLTLTETTYPVFRRPFCVTPAPERVRRVLEAAAAATEPLGRRLVVRPFSALRADELHVRAAVERLSARNVSLMYKTEPFDWHPSLPNEPLIGSVPRYENRAEADAGAEYYGQGVFPCSYVGHLEHRLTAAARNGATVAVLRVDRGARCPALGNPVNEGNLMAATRWALSPGTDFRDHWEGWFRARHGVDPAEWFPLLERTFGVIRGALYIDGQAFTHNRFPTFEQAKHVQAFGLLEEDVPLDHMARNWGIVSDRCTRSHEAVLAEKDRALAEARAILAAFDARAEALPPAARAALRALLARLPLLAEACLGFVRTALAHLQDVCRRPRRCVDAFEEEAGRLTALADRIERELGADFWAHMPERMRSIVDGLVRERRMEQPLRAEIEGRPGVEDYVLCGFASEGHRLAKMLHSGATPVCGARLVRQTGAGPDEGFAYTLCRPPGRAHKLRVLTAGADGGHAAGQVRIGEREHALPAAAPGGLRECLYDVPATAAAELPVHLWSVTPRPCCVAAFILEKA